MIDHELYSYSPGEDPGGRRARTFFSAVFEMERWQGIRLFVGALLIVTSVPCWIMAMWPELAHGVPRRLALTLWASLLVIFAYTAVAIWRSRRALAGFAARGAAATPAAGALRGGEHQGAPTLRARLERSRAALVSTTSHELRTPLAVITGAATTLRDGAAIPAAERGGLVESICGGAERLDLAVANVLDLLRLQPSATATLAREWVTCEELVGAALQRQETRLAGRAVDIRIPPDLPLLLVDPPLCERLLVNLVDLAARRGPAGTAIDIRARSTPAGVEILVADRGPDCAPGDLESDLGFVVCSRIVQAHHGRIAVEPRETGGMRILATLPLADQPPPPPDV